MSQYHHSTIETEPNIEADSTGEPESYIEFHPNIEICQCPENYENNLDSKQTGHTSNDQEERKSVKTLVESVMEDLDDKAAAMVEEKTRAQIMAGERSLKTNCFFFALFIGLFVMFALLSTNTILYFTAAVLPILKTVLPVFTAIANFGPVKSVVSQYWKNFRDKIKC